MNKQADRLNQIIHMLQLNKAYSINKIAENLGVSHMTIRRDLLTLENEDLVETFHGGVMLKHGVVKKSTYSFPAAVSRMTKEKIRIGKLAASLVETNDIVTIDTGTTMEYVSKYLPDKTPLTIICFALNVLMNVTPKKDCSIIFSGGYYHNNSLMFESAEGVELIKKNRATKAFISASGIHHNLGITCSNPYERDTKDAVIKSSLTKILCADSSKFHKIKKAFFANFDQFDVLITDDGIPQEYIHKCRDLGIKLYIA